MKHDPWASQRTEDGLVRMDYADRATCKSCARAWQEWDGAPTRLIAPSGLIHFAGEHEFSACGRDASWWLWPL